MAGFGAAYWANGTNDTVSIPVATGTSSTLLQTFGDLSNRTVRVIVHGFGSNCGLVWIYEMRTALMAVVSCFFLHPTPLRVGVKCLVFVLFLSLWYIAFPPFLSKPSLAPSPPR